jgi:DNA polymerase-3 subunit delta'
MCGVGETLADIISKKSSSHSRRPRDKSATDVVPSSIATTLDWRGLIGLEDVKANLSRCLDTTRMHPVVMFEGREGAGKRHLAMWMVARFFCTAEMTSQRGCGACGACREILAGLHRDVMILDLGRETIKTADVEQLQQFFDILSSESIRFGVIMNADRMTRDACNRLLKTLEEPPEQVRVILTTSRPLILPATLRGRCLRWKVKLPARSAVTQWMGAKLKDLGRPVESEQALKSWAMRSGYSVGNIAREMNEQVSIEDCGIHREVRTLLTATRPAQVLQAASDLARIHKAKVPEILGAVEWELSRLYTQSLSAVTGGEKQDQNEASIRFRRRGVLRDVRHLSVIGKVVLNAQLVAESIGLCRWEKREL